MNLKPKVRLSKVFYIKRKLLAKIDLYALIGVLVGVVLLGQPFSKFLFILAFPLILICTVTHMVLDHLI